MQAFLEGVCWLNRTYQYERELERRERARVAVDAGSTVTTLVRQSRTGNEVPGADRVVRGEAPRADGPAKGFSHVVAWFQTTAGSLSCARVDVEEGETATNGRAVLPASTVQYSASESTSPALQSMPEGSPALQSRPPTPVPWIEDEDMNMASAEPSTASAASDPPAEEAKPLSISAKDDCWMLDQKRPTCLICLETFVEDDGPKRSCEPLFSIFTREKKEERKVASCQKVPHFSRQGAMLLDAENVKKCPLPCKCQEGKEDVFLHRKCLQTWREQGKNRCPLCRRKMFQSPSAARQ